MKNPSQLKSLHEFHDNTNKCNKSKLKNYNKIPLLQQKVYSNKIEIYQLSSDWFTKGSVHNNNKWNTLIALINHGNNSLT